LSKAAKTAARILCAGGAVQDIIMRVDEFPHAGAKVTASEFLVTSGGQAGNAAVAVARLGAETHYIGALGGLDDDVANSIVKAFVAEGIDVGGVLRVTGARSSVSLILIDAAGEKMVATRRNTGLSEAVPANPEKAVAEVDAVLLDNRYANISMPIAQAAAKRGIPRVLDFDKPAPPDDPLTAASTHVICSADALRGATGLDDLGAALRLFGKNYDGFLAVTDGPAGVYWLDHGDVRHLDAFKIDAIDTLGAGDTFHGAFAVGLVDTGDIVAAMTFASAAAAIKCTRFGGLMGAPTRPEVDEFLRHHGASPR
jgi:sugar/nucleoside kinase (ribokinase family)